ncbi:MAG TPA: ABC transporter permease [Thermodesulfobacteriota bacterium]
MRRVRGAAGIVLAALAWEALARSGVFPRALAPDLRAVGGALWQMALDGTLAMHIGWTLARILVGLAIAASIGIPLGLLMGRFRPVERFVAPIVNVLMPIPSLAWVPMLILWFGLGNTATIALVVYAASFQFVYNAWAGVRAVNPIWIRAAVAMGADERTLFRRVVLPGALPYVITGFRLAFARSWIAVVGGEMIAASQWGLGWVIFDAKEFLNADVMMAALLVIGLLGLAFERFAFQGIERRTVARWGMVRTAAA